MLKTRAFHVLQRKLEVCKFPELFWLKNMFCLSLKGALCGAAYGPSAIAESAIAQGLVDEADAEQFKDFVKRFGGLW